jgi:transcriptional regulator with XRE-family HTH domain
MPAREFLDPDSSMWDWIAVDLRFWRLKHGLSGSQLGRIISCSRHTVSNLEAGRFKLTDAQAATLDRHFDLNGHFQRMLKYAREGHSPDWFREHLEYEARARQLKIYELAMVPGLLQTEAYARYQFTEAGVPEKEIEAQVSARMARQEILGRPSPPFVWVLLDEGVVDRPLGGPEVMREQLAKLLELSMLSHVSIRVVPKSAGWHFGLEGAFKVMTVDTSDVVYTEANAGGRLALSTVEVEAFAVRYDKIGVKALPEGSTRALVDELMEAMR